MTSITNNAYVMLVVAANGDANAGIPGISGRSELRSEFARPNWHTGISSYLEPGYNYKWYTRGWTFQELVLSHQVTFLGVEGFRYDEIIRHLDYEIGD